MVAASSLLKLFRRSSSLVLVLPAPSHDVRDGASVAPARRLGSRPEVYHLQNWVNKVEWTDTASPGKLATYISAYQHRQVRQFALQN